MVFKSLVGSKAMFTFGDRRYRCKDGLFDTNGLENQKELDEFLKANRNFDSGEAPVEKAESDGLEDLSLDELKALAAEEKVDSPSVLDRIKNEGTLIEKIRKNREEGE